MMSKCLGFQGAIVLVAGLGVAGCPGDDGANVGDESTTTDPSTGGDPTTAPSTSVTASTSTTASTNTTNDTTTTDDTTTSTDDSTTAADASTTTMGDDSTTMGDDSTTTMGDDSTTDIDSNSTVVDPTTEGSSTDGLGEADVEVVWSNEVSQNFCFYYSGPTVIGDAATWQQDGDDVTLVFPHVMLAFPETEFDPIYGGTLADEDLVLQGVIEHEFNGAPWQTTETFTGTFEDGVFTGSYLYEECDPAVPETCPGDGFCTITADFVMTLQ
jgi:hypothetical protein